MGFMKFNTGNHQFDICIAFVTRTRGRIMERYKKAKKKNKRIF